MAEDPLDDIIASVRSSLQVELERQLHAGAERHQQALASARRQIEADAEQQWTARLDALKLELESVRAEGAREIQTVRDETERRAAEEAARMRAEMEQALAAERQLSQSRLDAERHALEQLEQARHAFEAERGEWAASRAAAAQTPAPRTHSDTLLRGMQGIDAATSVSDSLAAIARAAAAEAPRAALFIANGAKVDEWAVSGLPSLSPGALNIDDPNAGIIVNALTKRQVVRNDGSACAVPLLLDGAPIAVLYGEADADGGGTTGWTDSLEAVARYGAARLGYLTALRTAQARQWLADAPAAARSGGAEAGSSGPTDEAVASARRYARLVVSEVKLYNEAAVLAGRSHGDLIDRLGSEIERARRLYDERVPASVPGRVDFFQQELVQILAGGDPSLLG